MKREKETYIEYVVLMVFIGIIVYLTLGLKGANLSQVPIDYVSSGDNITGLVTAKSMLEHGWIYSNPSIGAPYGVENYDATTMELLLSVIEQMFVSLTGNWVLGYNLFYLSAYFLIGITALYALKKLNISDVIALPLAILYAFVPYHMLRGTGHLYLGMYFMVPLMVLYLYRLMKEEQLFAKGKTVFQKDKEGWLTVSNILRMITLMLMALTGIYYAFFMCFFLCVVAMYRLLNGDGWKKLRQTGLCVGVVILTLLVGALPNVVYWMQNGRAEAVAAKGGEGAELYALKIVQLFLPIPNHRIGFFAKVREVYDTYYPLVNENGMASLGVIMSIGFVVLCIVLFVHHKVDRQSNLRIGSVFNLAAVLFGTIGGYAVILSFISGAIRCYNRFSIFIAMFSLIAIAELLQSFYNKLEKKKWYQGIFALGMLGLLAFGIYDQTTTVLPESYQYQEEQFYQDREFIQAIENAEIDGAMIYQLPYMRYPENGAIQNMPDYAHFVGYIHSNDLKWSYGSLAGREGNQWMSALSQLSLEEQLQEMKQVGFAGVYIDWNAYLPDERTAMEVMLESQADDYIQHVDGMKAYYSFY